MNDLDKRGGEAARAAWLYFHEQFTQSQIADELSVSRSTVTRLLQRAKDEGLVQITLNVTSGVFQTERELERAYRLERVRIVPYANEDDTQKRWLGHVAADLMNGLVVDNSITAVSWGTTMRAMTDWLVGQQPRSDAQIVALIGGLHNAAIGINTNEIARRLAQYFAAAVSLLLAPVYVQDEATAKGLIENPGIRDALSLARAASSVVYSLGAMHVDSTMFKLGHVSAEQKAYLEERGAVGDIACRWIDRDGYPVELPSSINPIGIPLEDLKKIPHRLAVAGGDQKRDIVLAALRGGFSTMLVTDERTAAYLVAKR